MLNIIFSNLGKRKLRTKLIDKGPQSPIWEKSRQQKIPRQDRLCMVCKILEDE